MTDYPNTRLYIDGEWVGGGSGGAVAVTNPATGARIGEVASADPADVERAAMAAQRSFTGWRRTAAFGRASIMRQAAAILRSRAEDVARIMTMEQGKPLAEARAETLAAADVIEWFAGEAQRTYGRVIPARSPSVFQTVIREPVGPVAAFSPWNFPINQIVRKISAALAAGCTIVAKCPDETPASPAALVQAFVDAGVPSGVLNLLYGDPAAISSHLIPHPAIRKITFTGSTAIGKQLASLAGQHMKRTTMELGGHAPVIIAADADLQLAVSALSISKYRNAGQVCISPTRFLIHESVYDKFEQMFSAAASAIVVGDGLDPMSQMGPLASERRLEAVDALVQDAVVQGAALRAGGRRIGDVGCFFQPTVLGSVPLSSRAMNEEPFGPVALLSSFGSVDDAIAEANRLPFGLASYAYTSSQALARRFADEIDAGMVAINSAPLALPETPNGGVKESGHGAEGGSEGIEAYLVTKFTTAA